MKSIILFVSPFFAYLAAAQTVQTTPDATKPIRLMVEPGTPLRVYLTKRLPKRLDEPVQAKLLEPLFAFDREVAPAGSAVLGKVSRLESVSKMTRTMAIFGGDFTPLHRAEVQFTTLVLPDGRQISLQTHETAGLNSIFIFNPPKKKQKQSSKTTQAPNDAVPSHPMQKSHRE